MTTATGTSDCVATPPKQPRRLWRVLLVPVIIAVSAVAVVSWLRPPTARFELISAKDYERRTKRLAFVQSARAWMTRFSPKIFGFAPVQISGGYVASDGEEQSHQLLDLPQPHYSSNAVRVWILSSNRVARAERSILSDNRSRWRNNTSSGTPSVLSMGPGFGGTLEFANHPKMRGGNVDLAAKVRSVLAGRTNSEIAFQVLLKRDEGAIVMDDAGVLFIWAHAP